MAYGFTYTLPTITGSHSDFPVLLKTADFPSAAIDGTANAIDNGGGNLRAYTSDAKTTQLPLEIVAFVSSGTPEGEVWVKIPTAATSNTIFIEADAVETAQPAVTATYGRDAVWADYNLVSHMDSTSPIDSSGNESLTANSLSASTGPWGNSIDFDGSASYIDCNNTAIPPASDYTYQVWVNFDVLSGFQGIIGAWDSGSSGQFYLGTSGTSANFDSYANSTNTFGTLSTSTWHKVTVSRTGTSTKRYIDGSLIDTITDAGSRPTVPQFLIGALDNGPSNYMDGKIAEANVGAIARNDNWLAAEYDNQNASTAWGTVGTWADAGGSTSPKGPFTHPLYGPFRGPIS